MILERAINHGAELCRLHPHGRQARRQAQAGTHVPDGIGNIAAAAQAHGMGHAVQAVFALHGFRFGVETHYRRQKHGIQRAVMQARVHAAQAVAQAVHAAQPFLKSHGSLHAGAHQLAARLAVLAVAGGTLYVGPAPGQPIECNAISGRVEGGCHEGLHAVRNGIHASGCCQQRWQAKGQFGVADGGLGHQMPAVKAQLAVVVHDDDGPARHLAACAAGGGHGNQWCHALADARRAAFNRGVVRQRSLVRGGNGHALGAVDGAAAAYGNQAVAALGFVDFSGCTHGRFRGVAGGLVKHRVGQVAQCIQGFLQNACCLHAGVGHDQGLADAHACAFLAQQLDGAKVELDLGDVIDKSHDRSAQSRNGDGENLEALCCTEKNANPAKSGLCVV